MASKQQKLESLGYTVGVAVEGFEAEGSSSPTSYRIEGHGISVVIPETDDDAWNRLVNPDAHQHRVNHERMNDPDDDFEMDDEAFLKSSLKAQISIGDITKAESDRHLADWKTEQDKVPSP